MMLAVDEDGTPRWEAARQRNGPKEDFAFEAALRIADGKLTLNQLKAHIISVANATFKSNGGSKTLITLNDVKEALGGSAKDWFNELKRVADHPDGIDEIIERKGKNLTALSRRYGPVQAQRRKAFSKSVPSHSMKDLIDTISRISAEIDRLDDLKLVSTVVEKAGNDLREYRRLLATINGITKAAK